MTTPQPSQLPEEVKPPYKISEREPVFPCWLWGCINIIYPSPVEHWRKHSDMPNAGLHYLPGRPDDKLRPGVFLATHWSPDQPTAPTVTPYLAPRPPAPRDAEWAARYLREHFSEEVRLYLVSVRSTAPSWDSHEQLVNALLLKFARHAPADSASAQLTALTAERDAAQAEVGRLNDYLATRKLVEMFPGTFAALDDVAVRYVATLRRERDELRAELLTTHQMACRVGLERDELAKLLGEVADELAVPGYDAPPISKGVQNLLSRIRAALQSLRALTEQPGKP